MIRQHRLPLDMIEPPEDSTIRYHCPCSTTMTLYHRTEYTMNEIEKLNRVREMARATCNGQYPWMAAVLNTYEILRRKEKTQCR